MKNPAIIWQWLINSDTPGDALESTLNPGEQLQIALLRLRQKLNSLSGTEMTLGSLLGAYIVLTGFCAYFSLFGIPGLLAIDVTSQIAAVGFGAMWLVFMGGVIATLAAPILERFLIAHNEAHYVGLARAVFAASVFLLPEAGVAAQWLFQFYLCGAYIVIAFDYTMNFWMGGDTDFKKKCKYLPYHIIIPMLTLMWMLVWSVAGASAIEPFVIDKPFIIKNFVFTFIILSGLSSYIIARFLYKPLFYSIIIGAFSIMCVSTPLLANMVRMSLYVTGMGGGRLAIKTSFDGQPLCDMGGFTTHFYVKPDPSKGCPEEYASTIVAQIWSTSGMARIKKLEAIRYKGRIRDETDSADNMDGEASRDTRAKP